MDMTLLKHGEFINWLVDSSVLAIVVADIKGNILLMSDSARKIFGDTDKLEVGKNIAAYLYIPGGAKSIMEKLRSDDYGGRGRLNPIRTTAIHCSGEEIPVEMTASIIYDDQGNEVGTMGIYQDLREKLLLEKQMEETRQLLEKSERLASTGRLAAGIAHAINDPLGGITMYAHLALEDISKDNPGAEKISIVIEQAGRLKKIVADLLEFSPEDHGSREDVNFNELIETVLSVIENHALFRNLHIIRKLADEIPLVHGDRGQLQQVIVNILFNSAESMDGKGQITIHTRAHRQGIEIDIEDTGKGIPTEDIPRLFDPFFSTKQSMERTGLGLSACHGIVTRHNGTMTIRSTPGKGTCFTVAFPGVNFHY
ncbi:MAG: ATP-binding protein [Pseudomonadota bacterium]